MISFWLIDHLPSSLDAGIKWRPTPSEVAELGPEFQEYWDSYFANATDKPVLWMGIASTCVPQQLDFFSAHHRAHHYGCLDSSEIIPWPLRENTTPWLNIPCVTYPLLLCTPDADTLRNTPLPADTLTSRTPTMPLRRLTLSRAISSRPSFLAALPSTSHTNKFFFQEGGRSSHDVGIQVPA